MKAQPIENYESENEILRWFEKESIRKIEFPPDILNDTPTISIDELIERKDHKIIDVRSSWEYQYDRIPGALHFPILENEERHKVGTIYKVLGRPEAIKAALFFAKPKIKKLEKKLSTIKDSKISVYCWRGGGRSKYVYRLLAERGIDVYRIDGGYKRYRNFVFNYLENLDSKNLNFLRICGLTGSGKSALLKEVRTVHSQRALDFEKLANHYGSVFGHIPPLNKKMRIETPSQSRFESELSQHLKRLLEDDAIIYCEDEGARIGKIHLPKQVLHSLKRSKAIWLETSLEKRIEYIRMDYFNTDLDQRSFKLFSEATLKLKRFLGKKLCEELISLLEVQNYDRFIEILLSRHYDKKYSKAESIKPVIKVNGDNIEEAAIEAVTKAASH